MAIFQQPFLTGGFPSMNRITGCSETTATYQNLTNDAEAALDNTYTIEAIKLGASSTLIGQTVTKLSLWIKQKTGSPTGTATMGVFNSSGSTLFTFGTLDVSADLTGSFQEITKENCTGYTLSSGEYIGLQYTNGDASNKITPGLDTTNGFDSTNTFRSRWSGSWGDSTTIDLTFKLWKAS